jgi:hypothetical protein
MKVFPTPLGSDMKVCFETVFEEINKFLDEQHKDGNAGRVKADLRLSANRFPGLHPPAADPSHVMLLTMKLGTSGLLFIISLEVVTRRLCTTSWGCKHAMPIMPVPCA